MIDKIRASMREALEIIPDGASIAVGGFGVTGAPLGLCDALCELGRKDLHIVSNNAGVTAEGVGRLSREKRIRKFTGSFPSNETFHKQYLAGTVEVELIPQGTMTERLRAAGHGIPAFYTPTSAGTILASGEYPLRLDASGEPAAYPPAKETRSFGGRDAVLEYALPVDFAFIKTYKADRLGNVAFRLAARNFNPVCAKAAAVTFAETEQVVPAGSLPPDDIHLPGIHVDHVLLSPRERLTWKDAR